MKRSSESPLLSIILIIGAISVFLTTLLFARAQDEDHTRSLGIQSSLKSVKVSAFIGEFRFTLIGYTSPFARVIFEGQGIFDETYANKYGEFTFLNRFSPLSSREACLTAQDTDGRISKPVCLPPFSVQKDVVIGPILLPPTLSVNQDYFVKDDYGIISGKAAPESEVAIEMYSDTVAQKIALMARTDEAGDYSLTLPTESQSSLRVFSLNLYKDLTSDTSNLLTLHILPIWMLIVRQLGVLLKWLMSFWLPLILVLEGLLLLWMLMGGRRKKHPLALRLPQPLVKQAL